MIMFKRAIVLLLVKVFCVCVQGTLQQVHIVFRNGDRSVISFYPKDPNHGHVWPNGLGQLTNEGKQQQFELGTFLREHYKNFLTTSDPREINVRSADVDRCLESAQVNLASFYKPKGKWVWNNKLDWQPVPIHTVPRVEDALLDVAAVCPEVNVALKEFEKSDAMKSYTKKYQPMFTSVSNHSGMTVKDPSSVIILHDTIFVEKLKNLKIPSWVNPIWSELGAAAKEALRLRFGSKKLQRLRGGPLVGKITSLMQHRSRTNSSSSEKAFMYSTHESTISAAMLAMGVFNGLKLPYCATLLTELHRINGADVVRLYYRNSTLPPHQLVIPGCAHDCPIDQFSQKMKDIIPTDWKKECAGVS